VHGQHQPVGPRKQSPMSEAVLARPGRLFVTAGQIARDAAGELVGPDDFARQAEFALERVLALTADAGGKPNDLISLRCNIVDRADIPALVEVRRRLLAEPYPAVTTVVVAGLADPRWLVEIEGMAVIDDEEQTGDADGRRDP